MRRHLPRLHEALSKADYDRLEALLPLFVHEENTQAGLAACLDCLMPGRSPQDQLAAFRALRQRLRKATRQAGLDWDLEVDSKKRSAPHQRYCWFTQPSMDRTMARAESFAEDVVASLPPTPAIHSLARVSVGPLPVRLFVSYDTERDRALAQDLLERLRLNFKVSQRYECETWDESQILVGENRLATMAAEIHKADFGLLLLSVSWWARCDPAGNLSVFMTEDGKPVLPVVLRDIDVTRQQLHGLETRALFRWGEKSFAACRTDLEKDQFALQLVQQIEQRLDRWQEVQRLAVPVPTLLGKRPRAMDLHAFESHAERLLYAWEADPTTLEHMIPAQARATGLHDSLDTTPDDNPEERSVVALEALQRWATDPTETPYCALLGEYGMGKTTTLKQFTAALLEQRRAGQAGPLPIFLDLRLYSPTVHRGEVPDLRTLLQEMLDRVWESPQAPGCSAEDILRLVREEGAILIFDGLDEKLVHLDDTQGRAFLRTLLNALPPLALRPERRRAEAGQPGRLIFSCRSHYFPTLRAQNAMLATEGRDSVRAAAYRAWVLLPFNDAQIRAYLSGVLGAEHAEDALELFAAVHNLRELAQRPYLLSLMTEHIGALEQRRAHGEVVLGVTLYDLMVDAWLERDGGKHHLRPEDKQRLMEDIAADMWRDGAREWEWPRVLAWLGTRLAEDHVLHTRYAHVAPALLEEDFRTATFVLRPDSSQEDFRFAHTSLQEYFLARALLRTLIEHTPGGWDLPLPSPETLHFLGQLLATAPTRRRATALQALEQLLEQYQPLATDIALRYWLQAIEHDLPTPTPRRVDLHGADLSGLTFRGRSAEQRLSLVDANLADTHLVGTWFENVDLSGADLSRVRATDAEFHYVLAHDLTATEADFTAAIWRHSVARGLRGGATAQWYECRWMACDLDPATLPPDFARQGTMSLPGPMASPLPAIASGVLTEVLGHTGTVYACAYAPDGATVLSGAWDHTLKLWDVRSGEVLMTLLNAPNGESAALDGRHNRILAASPGAWRYLGWRVFDPEANRLRILPAEHFGPLPVG
jgi:uncharacterized protein YjbI with pentapeptide repeats